MRLIDADELIKEIEQSRNDNPHKDCCVKINHDMEHDHFIKMVMQQKTAFDKNNVINEIKEYKEDAEEWAKKSTENPDEFYTYADAYKNCLEIVEKGGI